jgi:outer membrane protein OmpA-like peptidoglycan-associated protein
MKKIWKISALLIVFIAGFSFTTAQINQDSTINIRTFFTSSKDSIYFDENSAELKDIYKTKLDSFVHYLIKTPKVTLLIYAYEHEFEIEKIANKRAIAVKEFLEKAGLPSNRLITKVLPTMLAQHEDAKFLPGEKEELRRVIIRIVN